MKKWHTEIKYKYFKTKKEWQKLFKIKTENIKIIAHTKF